MSKKMDKILAEISAGELIDKITILEIKKEKISNKEKLMEVDKDCLLYTSPSPRDVEESRMPSSA